MENSLIKEFILSLREQIINLNKFLLAAQKKQKALIQSKIDDIQNAVIEEEKTLFNIDSVERIREKIIEKIQESYGLPKEIVKIFDINKRLKGVISEEEAEDLFECEALIKETIDKINMQNERNRFIINRSKAYLKETLTSLLEISKRSALVDKRC